MLRKTDFASLGIILFLVFTLVLGLDLVKKTQVYLSEAIGDRAEIVVDASSSLGPITPFWQTLAQGGEEKEPFKNIPEEIAELKPAYIRVDHIYDFYNVVSRDNGRLKFDWTQLDLLVDDILKAGAKPFFALSYMPPAISKGDIIDLPTNWGDWGQVVRATVEHYSGRNNRNINGVIYEVWNEPDLFGSYKTYGDKNYLTMYEVSSRAAQGATNVNAFEIGGPATTGLYQNWEERLIKFVDEKNLRLDFLSWHRYDTDLTQFEEDVDRARSWAEKIPALVNLKFYITEWGHNSENDPGYDGKFGAIHTIAASRVMMAKVQRAFVFEIKDGPGNEKYWSRWGLLTHEKFGAPEKKPRYKALELLNTLGPFRISLAGEGSWVKGIASTDEAGDIKLMVVNYDASGKHSESVPITFENLPNGNFKFTRRDFLGGTRTTPVATTAATWRTVEYFVPNSAAMITLDF